MTLKEFAAFCHNEIKVMSAFNGKLLCRAFSPEKHGEIGDREVESVWAEIRATSNFAYGNSAKPIICVFVNGAEECRKALAKMRGEEQ